MAARVEDKQLYRIQTTTDHDQKVKVEKQEILCYSQKQLDKLYPDGGYENRGETRQNKKKRLVAQLQAGKEYLDVAEYKEHNRILNRTAGFVRVGGDKYIAILKPRWLFLLLMLLMMLLLVLSMAVLIQGPEDPLVLIPDHPLPGKDPNVEIIEGDDSEKTEVEKGGGSVSMIYTLEASASLSDGKIEIYFKNPNASSHDVAVEMYLISGEKQILIAQSGRIEPGFALHRLDLMSESVTLSEGIYTGLYRLQCYDPETGERALVSPEITGLTVTVTN